MSIGWDATMTTGVPQIDNEHIELFRQVANLGQAMREGKSLQEIEKIFAFGGDYILEHFAHEEKYMADYRCPAADMNKAAHANLMAKFKYLQDLIQSEGATSVLTLELYDTLQNWLVQHIRQIDARLLPCTKAAKQEPALAMSK